MKCKMVTISTDNKERAVITVMCVVTVSEALARARKDGIPISEYSLRRWLKTNQIPCRMAGSKTLIYYPHIIEFFTRVPASQLVAQEMWENHDSE